MSAVGSAYGRPSPAATDLLETPAASDTDDSMPELQPVTAVANESSGNIDVRQQNIRSEVEKLLYVTIDGLHKAAQHEKPSIKALNLFLRQKYEVSLKGIGFDENGDAFVVFKEFYEQSHRKCRWDQQYYSLKETLEWTLRRRQACLQWALDFWERDFA